MRSVDEAVKEGGWLGTPFATGQSTPGKDGGADCVGFVAGLLGSDARQWRKLRPHHAQTAPKRAEFALRAIIAQHDAVQIDAPEPWAVVVWQPVGGGPSHVGVVADDIRVAWHCIAGIGVCKSGLRSLWKHKIRGFYRGRLTSLPQSDIL
jgi:hypothetical protein